MRSPITHSHSPVGVAIKIRGVECWMLLFSEFLWIASIRFWGRSSGQRLDRVWNNRFQSARFWAGSWRFESNLNLKTIKLFFGLYFEYSILLVAKRNSSIFFHFFCCLSRLISLLVSYFFVRFPENLLLNPKNISISFNNSNKKGYSLCVLA